MRTSRKGTKTSRFGASKRESHDASLFYRSRLYNKRVLEGKIPYVENTIDGKILDQVIHKSSEKMDELPDNCTHLMVTSPPYNVSKEYDEDLTLGEYIDQLAKVFSEVYRTLVPGGRACVNIANVGRKPYIPFHSFIIQTMTEIGFLMRGEIIWNKSASSGTSTAWGSWQSAANPTLRDIHEYILIFCKQSFSRKKEGREDTISKEEFLEYTKSVWTFPTESAKKVGHPAPFPVELPYRLIHLYTFKGDVVLDPFIGSGTTALAALRSGRHFIGYDTQKEYVNLANNRIKAESMHTLGS
jgi:site-specific DNA-methyltransferase (adenine-specific)